MMMAESLIVIMPYEYITIKSRDAVVFCSPDSMKWVLRENVPAERRSTRLAQNDQLEP
jgi:hypothetical protein